MFFFCPSARALPRSFFKRFLRSFFILRDPDFLVWSPACKQRSAMVGTYNRRQHKRNKRYATHMRIVG